jgi:hypothetical protein
MIDDELFDKFEQIQDLNVSEEMLGAYLEGNLSPTEIFEVESAMREDENLEVLANIDPSFDHADVDNFSDINEVDLPSIPDDSFIELDLEYPSALEIEDLEYAAASSMDDGHSYDENYTDNDIETTFGEEDDTSFDSSDDNNEIIYE